MTMLNSNHSGCETACRNISTRQHSASTHTCRAAALETAFAVAAFALSLPLTTFAAGRTAVAHSAEGEPNFLLGTVAAPSKTDSATAATISLVSGRSDGNGAGIAALNDGMLPTEADEPSRNFFFAPETDGGRILVDLRSVTEIKAINTYSWHPTDRGPQVYQLFASDGAAPGFTPGPERGSNLTNSGWKLIADVDTRISGGGQHCVSTAAAEGILGSYRYILFDISRTESGAPFDNTFYSEIDVIGANDAASTNTPESLIALKSADGYCDISIDVSEASDLREWAERRLAPVLAEWFPKIVALLPSEGYEAPRRFSVTFKPMDGVAFASGNRITANSEWIRRELDGEAIGALVHEVVHVVQHPSRGRRATGGRRSPGWLVEGVPDYIRFFLFEPHTHGADLLWIKARPNMNLNHDARYRVTANFLNYVVENYDPEKSLIARINAACREGRYEDELWQEFTGKPLSELNDEWKAAVRERIEAANRPNVLTESEISQGWQLLFTGTNLSGWHTFKREDVRPGWQVKDGALVCVDPKNAGDLVTREKFEAFELELEYNISPAGNSGILFHVTDEGGAVWATGPEFQLEDNAKAADPQRCGWLYALYRPQNDPRNGKPIDATLPAGKWNHVRLVITPENCEHWINGVKYFDYVLDGDDFRKRVAASKFSRMPLFAKARSGYIALQGDHGEVSFRSIKIRRVDKQFQTSAAE